MTRVLAATAIFINTAAAAEFRLYGFQSARDVQLVGSARVEGAVLRLTPARRQLAGAAWANEKFRVNGGFETSFRFQLTAQGGLGNGADGFAFVLQNSGASAIAGRGASGGFALGDGYGHSDKPGIPQSIAVFFDTHRNGDAEDPSDNYVAICTNGKIGEMRWPPGRLAMAKKLPFRLKDGRPHRARIVYHPPVMSLFLDDAPNPVLTAAVDLRTVLDDSGRAFVGFTASTGNGYENHDILDWHFSSADVSSDISMVSSKISFLLTACLEGRNLCTPERATVEQTTPDQYHIVLPAHLEWGASIPNPSGRQVVINDAHGTVCHDLAGRGSDGCGGPFGRQASPPGGSVFIVPAARPGALVFKTEGGRTLFSVNDIRASGFSDNQGYFEFDVRLQ